MQRTRLALYRGDIIYVQLAKRQPNMELKVQVTGASNVGQRVLLGGFNFTIERRP